MPLGLHAGKVAAGHLDCRDGIQSIGSRSERERENITPSMVALRNKKQSFFFVCAAKYV